MTLFEHSPHSLRLRTPFGNTIPSDIFTMAGLASIIKRVSFMGFSRKNYNPFGSEPLWYHVYIYEEGREKSSFGGYLLHPC